MEKERKEETKKQAYIKACKKSANIFIASSTYGVLRTGLTSFLTLQIPSISEIVSAALQEGVNFTAFPFVKELASATVGEDIEKQKPYVLIPVYAGLSAVSSLAINLLRMPKKKDEKTQKETKNYDYKQFFKNVQATAISTSAFNVASHYLGAALPKPQTIVDSYLNSSAQILVGNAAGMIASMPVLMKEANVSVPEMALGYFVTVPLVFVDNAIYYGAKNITKPLRIK